jgi:transcriptional regulator with XRE-family HTH domain
MAPLVNEKAVEKLLEEIGKKLTYLRKKKGYTSYETFAYDYDLPRAYYWRMEKGKVNITIRSLSKILAIHKMTMDEFFSMDKKLK